MTVGHFFLLIIATGISAIILKRVVSSKIKMRDQAEHRISNKESPYTPPESDLGTLDNKSTPKKGRHWAQYFFGLPFLFLSIFAFITAKPTTSIDKGMSQVDLLYNIAGVLGIYTPATILLIIATLILRKRKPKLTHENIEI